jgi:hypothetical protein
MLMSRRAFLTYVAKAYQSQSLEVLGCFKLHLWRGVLGFIRKPMRVPYFCVLFHLYDQIYKNLPPFPVGLYDK